MTTKRNKKTGGNVSVFFTKHLGEIQLPAPAIPLNPACLKSLIHYAVDKASPYELAMYPETDEFDDISGARLTELAITPQGFAQLWLLINSHCAKCGASQVPPSQAGKCRTVQDLYDAVITASK